MILQIPPIGFYENAKDGAITPVSVNIGLAGATDNQLAVTGVTGKVIVVTSGNAFSGGVASSIYFRDGSAGTIRRSYYVPANTVATPNVQFGEDPFNGLFRTLTAGNGLYVNNTAAVGVDLSFTYYLYTPG